MANEIGFTELRLPPYHCELSLIELIWSQMWNCCNLRRVDRRRRHYQPDQLKRDLHSSPRSQYEGPYRVISRTDKVYLIQKGDKETYVSIDRLKPAFLLGEPSVDSTCPIYKDEVNNATQFLGIALTPVHVHDVGVEINLLLNSRK
ncbi:hypothetical protein MSG28_009044 [Choristoneura fumiferana]|uniref:Uncharacterized protein n=1 Tax=Choristoneura fumiferana TaxID=7141 RepID=A0ACC0KWY1_CHOFU|nr:hypothetical protein MSG28_009044 [Choristoneura fumiferana]